MIMAQSRIGFLFFLLFFVDNRVHVLSRANHAELVRERQVGGGLRTEVLAASAASFSVGRVRTVPNTF